MTQRNPSAKFIELANKRVNKTIKDIRLVGNLSNKTIYSYDETQAKKIIKVLQREIDLLKARFTGTDNETEEIFKL
jgi:ABC-type Fe3+-hydroxamate transport system substrate-binding protein